MWFVEFAKNERNSADSRSCCLIFFLQLISCCPSILRKFQTLLIVELRYNAAQIVSLIVGRLEFHNVKSIGNNTLIIGTAP